jgi:glucokinase-like ROK family protein
VEVLAAVRPENAHQARLLQVLRDAGPHPRASLGDLVSLSRSRLAAELDRLVARGLVDVGGPGASRGGRRSSVVRVAAGTRFLGVDVGATAVRVALTDGELNLLAYRHEPMDVRRGPEAGLRRVVELAGTLGAGPAGVRLAGAGVGLPGPVSVRDGTPVSPPIMPGWHRFPVREVLATELGCPVLVDNDVNIMALGERQAGVARAVDDFLFIKIGTGIGCGIVVRGEVYRGTTGCAGDIGHICVSVDGPVCACGNTGCLEAYFGGAALARDAAAAASAGRSAFLAHRLAEAGTLGPSDVADAADAGDPVARDLVRDGAARIGEVLGGLVSFVNPGLVVVGGRVAGMGHALLAGIRSAVYRRSVPLPAAPPIVLSELGDRAGVVGAARLASDHVFSAA